MKSTILSPLAIFLLLSIVGCQPMMVKNAVPVNELPEVSDLAQKYFIQVGDTIRITINDMSSGTVDQAEYELPVRPDGKILLPLMNDPIRVAGYTTKEVRDNLKSAYKKYVKDPAVLVNIIEFSHRVVYVVGETGGGTPDPVPYGTRLTALRAIAAAGYDTLRANLQNVIVVRSQGAEKNPLITSLRIKDAIKNVDASQDIKLSPNDVIVIPKKGIIAVNDFVDQYINKNVPLPGLTYGIGTAIVIDRVLDRD